MRILVVGAGALGGYFGGRLKEAGRDVTFLVRPRRAEQLAKSGLVIRSPRGDVTIAQPLTIFADRLRTPFDLILLSCKAYDLPSAINSFAPAVGPNTAILPLLNGMKHMDLLCARIRRRRGARRSMYHFGDARCRGPRHPSQRSAFLVIRRTEWPANRAHRGDCCSAVRRRFRSRNSPRRSCRKCGRNGLSSPRRRGSAV